jgi:hypothetical protein
MRAELKRLVLGLAYPRWRRVAQAAEGYTVIVPAPMDMPFLCYLALAGLRELDLRHCHEILVVPDGVGAPDTSALAQAIAAAAPRTPVRLLDASARQRVALALGRLNPGVAHWTQIVESIDAARTDALFLHDADAFFTDGALLETGYSAFRAQELRTLGVSARWDPVFTNAAMQIPSTWELMFSARWARGWRPIDHKSGLRDTAQGRILFDTMLYPQYCDYGSGGIVVRHSESFLHLSGTIATYREFMSYRDRPVGDELFRLLFLSLLRESSPAFPDGCALPRVAELEAGLLDSSRRVHYRFPAAAEKYAEFRGFVARLTQTPLFRAQAEVLTALVRPFDEHFAARQPQAYTPELGRLRQHGLWLDRPAV